MYKARLWREVLTDIFLLKRTESDMTEATAAAAAAPRADSQCRILDLD